ncbi:uncharacterized protein L201_006750 [Kwoniella dendrophila CBS 6074]|uniref:Uncharacterized protein n=1 Tax=Kwoniella dendrophila CBS 6074 TaxID=1295534 RepID=A0AAX4K3Y5_9TREE
MSFDQDESAFVTDSESDLESDYDFDTEFGKKRVPGLTRQDSLLHRRIKREQRYSGGGGLSSNSFDNVNSITKGRIDPNSISLQDPALKSYFDKNPRMLVSDTEEDTGEEENNTNQTRLTLERQNSKNIQDRSALYDGFRDKSNVLTGVDYKSQFDPHRAKREWKRKLKRSKASKSSENNDDDNTNSSPRSSVSSSSTSSASSSDPLAPFDHSDKTAKLQLQLERTKSLEDYETEILEGMENKLPTSAW